MAIARVHLLGALCLHACTVDGFDLSPGRRSSASCHKQPIDRRSVISAAGSIATGALLIASAPEKVLAAGDEETSKPAVKEYIVKDFAVSLPLNWKVTSQPDNSKWGQNPKLFSAIDFQSGSVITVVNERACNVQEYARSAKACNIVLPSDRGLFTEDTIAKDVSKLLIRHDDRDNTELQGTTKLDSYDLNKNVLDLTATTTLPSGGTYRDTMGIDRPDTIDRKLKAKALVSVTENDASVLTLWLNAPLDEWQNPVMGTKLNAIWESVNFN